MSDVEDDLRKARAAFSKGLAGVSLLTERNQADVEKLMSDREKDSEALQEIKQTVARLDERVPEDLKERLTKLEGAAETAREDTRRVRTLEKNEAAEITKDKREASKWTTYGTVGAAIVSAIAAIVAAAIALMGGG